jgi:hypothetical protein
MLSEISERSHENAIADVKLPSANPYGSRPREQARSVLLGSGVSNGETP